MTYTIALSYSNFQHVYGLPHITTAVVVKTIDVNKIPKLMDNDFMYDTTNKSVLSAFDPRIIQEKINPYESLIILKKAIYEKKPKKNINIENSGDRIIKSYYKMLDREIRSDIRLIDENIDFCVLKMPMDKNGVELDMHNILKQYSFALYNFPVKFEGREDSSGVLDFARLYANDIYLKRRRENIFFVNAALKNNLKNIYQIIRTSWNSVPVEYYNNEFVGFPNLIIRENFIVKTQTLELGDHFSFFPLAKYCVGPTAGIDEPIPTCMATTKKKPFGANLEGTSYEKCRKCGGGKDDLSFLYKARQGDNKTAKMVNEDIVRRIFLGEFVIYATHFDNTLKVGRALKSRVISRLIEQASLDALVFFPLPGYEFATELEILFKVFIKKHMKKLNIEKVSDRVQQITRYKNIIKTNLNSDDNSDIYNDISELVMNTDDKKIHMLSQFETRILNLTNNWVSHEDFPDKMEHFNKFKRIEGIVNGLVGTFMLINNKSYDFKQLNGCVGVSYD